MRRKAVRVIRPLESTEGLVIQAQISARATPIPLCEDSPSRLPIVFARSNSELEANSVFSQNAVSPRPFLSKEIRRSKVYFYTLLAATFLSFVLDDLRVIALSQSADSAVDGVLLVVVALFCGDMAVQVAGGGEYVGSLLFWLDLWATLGLLGDVMVVYQAFISECDTRYFHRLRITVRSARLSGSLISLVRQLNLTIAGKLKKRQAPPSDQYPFTPRSPQGPKIAHSNSNFISLIDDPPTILDLDSGRPSKAKMERLNTDMTSRRKYERKMGTFRRLYRPGVGVETVGKRSHGETILLYESNISKRTTRQLVGILSALSLTLGLFLWLHAQPSSYAEDHFALSLLQAAISLPRADEFLQAYIDRYSDSQSLAVLERVSIDGALRWWTGKEEIRSIARCVCSYESMRVEFDISNKLRTLAVFDLCETLLLCVLFFYACLDVSAYIRNMILFPLERMIDTVQLLWKNQLYLVRSPPVRAKSVQLARKCCESPKDFAQEEIAILENAVRKIGLMLGLVYGSAGSEMIANSIDLEGEFTPIVRGKEVLAVFCFAKIGDFDWALDTLGPGILAYINLVSGFVHNTVERYLGSVNRNLGDSYLLVWKFQSEDGVMVDRKMVLNPFSSVVRSTTSLALMFAIKAISKVTTNRHISWHRELFEGGRGNSALIFGFHVGWAYEGPIGSAYKIDASYLSPNVNMAARLETAAQQYNVHILVSHEMYIRLEDEVKGYIRHIDTVKLKGVHAPVLLYSLDLYPRPGFSSCHVPNKRTTQKKRNRLKHALESGLLTIPQLFSHSDTVTALRLHYPKEFFEHYDSALILYLAGRWREACDTFTSDCLSLVPFDGPTKTLVSYMDQLERIPPLGWHGVRELLCK